MERYSTCLDYKHLARASMCIEPMSSLSDVPVDNSSLVNFKRSHGSVAIFALCTFHVKDMDDQIWHWNCVGWQSTASLHTHGWLQMVELENRTGKKKSHKLLGTTEQGLDQTGRGQHHGFTRRVSVSAVVVRRANVSVVLSPVRTMTRTVRVFCIFCLLEAEKNDMCEYVVQICVNWEAWLTKDST